MNSAVLYVSTTGDDSGNCTEEAPCQTITRASRLAVAGDIVQVAPGNYDERVVLTFSGSASEPEEGSGGGWITYQGHDGTGCPTEKIDDLNSPRGTRPVPKAIIKGFTVNASYIRMDCFDITNTTQSGVNVGELQHHIEMLNSYVHDIAGAGINMPRAEVAKLPQDLLVKGNYVTRTGYGFLIFCRDRCVIEENEVERNISNVAGNDMDYSRLFGEGITFRANYYHGNSTKDCVGCHIDCFQTWNLASAPYEVARRVTIDGNVCFNAHQGVIANDATTSRFAIGAISDWTVTNNVFNYGPEGSRMAWCALFTKVEKIVFAHNLCGTGLTGYRQGSTSTHINNIHFMNGTRPYVGETGSTVKAERNFLFNPTIRYQVGNTTDIVNEDPLFVDPGKADFRLQPSSPVMGRGIAASVRWDRFKRERPEGLPPDIGPSQGAGGGERAEPEPEPDPETEPQQPPLDNEAPLKAPLNAKKQRRT